MDLLNIFDTDKLNKIVIIDPPVLNFKQMSTSSVQVIITFS